MVILRRTQKLRKLLPVSAAVTPESETALGDWYVNRVMVNRRPLLLVVSSRGLFPLLVPARDVGSLPERLPHLVASALRRLSSRSTTPWRRCSWPQPAIARFLA
jgi:hypothetical protein